MIRKDDDVNGCAWLRYMLSTSWIFSNNNSWPLRRKFSLICTHNTVGIWTHHHTLSFRGSSMSYFFCGNDLLKHSVKLKNSAACVQCVDQIDRHCGGSRFMSLYKIRGELTVLDTLIAFRRATSRNINYFTLHFL